MTDFFKLQVNPKPFLWLGLALGVVAEFFLINWALYAIWMNAHPLYDNIHWGYIFFVRASVVLIVGLLCFWPWFVSLESTVRKCRKEREASYA